MTKINKKQAKYILKELNDTIEDKLMPLKQNITQIKEQNEDIIYSQNKIIEQSNYLTEQNRLDKLEMYTRIDETTREHYKNTRQIFESAQVEDKLKLLDQFESSINPNNEPSPKVEQETTSNEDFKKIIAASGVPNKVKFKRLISLWKTLVKHKRKSIAFALLLFVIKLYMPEISSETLAVFEFILSLTGN